MDDQQSIIEASLNPDEFEAFRRRQDEFVALMHQWGEAAIPSLEKFVAVMRQWGEAAIPFMHQWAEALESLEMTQDSPENPQPQSGNLDWEE